jgi:hypothetical protein
MRAWRTPAGFLVDLGPTSQPVISSLAAELPDGPWRELHEYATVDSAGVVRERFRVSVWSLDDDLGVSAHAVIGGDLRNLTVVVSCHGRVRRDEQSVVSGLQELSDTTFVREAVARHERAENEAVDRSRRESDARVAAVRDALEDFGLGDPFRRAQGALLQRIRAYGDELAVDLLRTLADFGRLHRSLGREPAFEAALDAYVTACRLAAFDPAPAARPFSGSGIAVPAMGEALSGLERRLLEAAEGQEIADAGNNAIQYRNAADHVARARTLLGPSIR